MPNNQGNPLVTHYDYDTVNRLTQVNYPAQLGAANPYGKIVNPTYDETSRLKELKVDNQIQMSEIVYNPMSQVTQLKTGAATNNADVETYAYDGQTGLLTNQKVIKANSNQTLLDLSYEYNRGNSNGNLNGKTGQLTHITNNLDRNKDRVFEFDTLGRLVTAKGGGATGVSGVTANWTQSYAYDRYGNRTGVTASGITQNSQTVPTDGLATQSYDQPSNRINTSGYIYDLAGNLVRGQDQAGNWQRYEYDTAGRLIHVKDDAGNDKLNNGYTSSRQRLVSWQPGVTDLTWFVWGGQSVIAEYKSTTWGNDPLVWDKSYIYAGSRLLATYTKDGSGERQDFHHPDRLGTKLVTNDAANTLFEQSTLPFGTSLDAEAIGTNTTNQKFTSYDRSSVTGIDYAVNRSYSPAQGRFTSVDPIGMSATSIGNPQSMNLYAYTQNNPVDFIDPSGLIEGPPRVGCKFDNEKGKWVCPAEEPDWGALWDLINGHDYPTFGDPGSGGEPGGGGGGEVPPHEPQKQEQTCGVNPITRQPGINAVPSGIVGELRPGIGGKGGFRQRTGGRHDGIDIRANTEHLVFANRDGVVAFNGKVNGYGNVLVIKHANNIYTTYAHLGVPSGFSVGMEVDQGDPVGSAGRTGNVPKNQLESEDHLHFGVSTSILPKGGGSGWLDPVKYLNSPCP